MPLQQQYMQKGFGDAVGGAAGGALAGGKIGSFFPGVGTATGAAIGGVLGGAAGFFGGSDTTTAPFDFPIVQNTPSIKSAKSNILFGTQGNFDPNALLPTGQTTGGFQFNSFPGGFQQFASQGQRTAPQNLDQAIAMGGAAQDQYVNQQLGLQAPVGQAPGFQQLGPQGQSIIQNIQSMQNEYQQALANGNSKQAQNIAQNIQAEMNKLGVFGEGILQGKTPFQDQTALQSAGFGNLGLGFQNTQNAQGAAGSLISQGANFVGQGQDRFNTQAGTLQNTIGRNNNQFQTFFGGLSQSDPTNNINQATSFGVYSPETISRAYGLADTAGSLAQSTFGDKDLARNILLQDISQRGDLINRGLATGIDPTTQGIADSIRQQTLDSFTSRLTGGDLADQLNNRFATAQANAAARGLGSGSSPVLQAGIEVEKERARLLNDATNQANLAANNTLLNIRQQQQAAALQGAGLLNQSAINSLGQFAPLISAGASAVNAGSGALNAATNAQTAGANIYSQGAQNQIQQGQLGVQQGQLLLQGQGQQQQALQALINAALQGDSQAAQNLNALAGQSINAGQLGVAQGQLGLQSQGQGFDQIMAALQAFEQQKNNRQNVLITQAAANAGAGVD